MSDDRYQELLWDEQIERTNCCEHVRAYHRFQDAKVVRLRHPTEQVPVFGVWHNPMNRKDGK